MDARFCVVVVVVGCMVLRRSVLRVKKLARDTSSYLSSYTSFQVYTNTATITTNTNQIKKIHPPSHIDIIVSHQLYINTHTHYTIITKTNHIIATTITYIEFFVWIILPLNVVVVVGVVSSYYYI